ncbi:MAG TPA: AAA family ATPase [Candidatus Omnitrophota bacterium]|nr:AAA family ATPase [Candidatus Omnitrophota bacterium]
MGYIIALAGKGGTGKTTIAALIVRLIKEKKLGSILAVDADPNSNLHESLGVELKQTIGGIIDEMCQDPQKVPAGVSKDAYMEYEIETAISEGSGFAVLTMGRPEGPGCYCYANNVLRNVMGKLIKDYDYVIIDNEAGLEHLSRRTTRSADALVVVSDATKVGLKAAQRINDLARELKIKVKKSFLLVNQCAQDIEEEKIKGLGLDYLGSLPMDKQIEQFSLNGRPLMGLEDDAASIVTLKKIGGKIWQGN